MKYMDSFGLAAFAERRVPDFSPFRAGPAAVAAAASPPGFASLPSGPRP